MTVSLLTDTIIQTELIFKWEFVMIPLLLGLILSFFGCYGAEGKDPRDLLAQRGLMYDYRGGIVPMKPGDKEAYYIIKRQQESDAAQQAAFRAEQRRARGAQARAILPQPGAQQIDVDNVVTEQPSLQPNVAFGRGASTVNTYNGLPYCVCAPVVIKNGGAGCPLRFCCACNTCGLPRVVVAGCLATNNTAINLPKIKNGNYDQAAHVGDFVPGMKTTWNFAPSSVGKLVCLCCGGCCVTVNQDEE